MIDPALSSPSFSTGSPEVTPTRFPWQRSPQPAGIFRPGQTDPTPILVEGVSPGLTLAMTEEPPGGSQQPTGDILLSAELRSCAPPAVSRCRSHDPAHPATGVRHFAPGRMRNGLTARYLVVGGELDHHDPVVPTTLPTTTTEAPMSTTTTTSPDRSIPGEPVDFGPMEGDRLMVIGVSHEDSVNMRELPRYRIRCRRPDPS